MKKFWSKIKSHLPSKRKIIQLYAALLFNANIKGYITGKIYRGALKNICTPGLNCYSCPGATGACPLGSLQNSLNQANKRIPYYLLGIIILYGIIFGRFICGFLCPFGLIQELFHKIKTPKLKKNKFTRLLSHLKYVILVFFVIIVPVLYGLRKIPLPGFCKYICPAGTIEGAFGLLSNKVNSSLFASLGPLFTWKFALAVSFILGSVFIFRFFCRFFCPLGALYSLFNKISVFGIKVEKSKCTDCGLCTAKCQMDVRRVGDRECISCGECISACPTGAIRWKGSKPFLAPNAIDENASPLEVQNFHDTTKKIARRNKALKIIAAILMTSLLVFVIVDVNFGDMLKNSDNTPVTPETQETQPTDTHETNDGSTPNPDKPKLPVGSAVGYLCPSYDAPLFNQNGEMGKTFNPAENSGKITVVNFWGTWCSGCVAELPYFDRIASEYKDDVTVIAIHSDLDYDTAADWVGDYYPNTNMLFGKDVLSDPDDDEAPDKYFAALGGTDQYPITVVVDEDGVIIASLLRATTYDELKTIIDAELSK